MASSNFVGHGRLRYSSLSVEGGDLDSIVLSTFGNILVLRGGGEHESLVKTGGCDVRGGMMYWCPCAERVAPDSVYPRESS